MKVYRSVLLPHCGIKTLGIGEPVAAERPW